MVEVEKSSQAFLFPLSPFVLQNRVQCTTTIPFSSVPFGGAQSKLTELRFEARPKATTRSKAQILLSLLCVAGTVHLSVSLARSTQADRHLLLLYASLFHLVTQDGGEDVEAKQRKYNEVE